VKATECSKLIREAEEMSSELQRMREVVGTHNNKNAGIGRYHW
jgi:hypothetical protein